MPSQNKIETTFPNSHLLRMHKAFYQHQNIGSAWGENMFTFFATNNNFIANYYAQMIVPLINQANETVNIIELGGGQGRFAFQLLCLLKQKLNHNSKFKYILTDISTKSLFAWKKHPKMQSFLQDGLLDLAIIDLNNCKNSVLDSGELLTETLRNCCNIVISNYALSDLAGDLFSVQGGQLFECLLSYDKSMESITEEESLDALKAAEIEFILKPVGSEYYQQQPINDILRHYRDEYTTASFEIPVDVIQTFDFFKSISSELYWFISDEAFTLPEHLKNRKPGLQRLSTGLFSNKVNLHALGLYLRSHQYEIVSKPIPNVVFDSYVLVSRDCAMRKFLAASINQFNSNDFLHIFHSYSENQELSPKTLFALISLSEFDPGVVKKFKQPLLSLSGSKRRFYRSTLRQYLKQIWEKYFDIGEEYDLAYDMGRMFRRLRDYQSAIECFSYSINKYGEYPGSCYKLGRCYQDLEQHRQAIIQFEKSLKIRPENDKTLKALKKSQIIINENF